MPMSKQHKAGPEDADVRPREMKKSAEGSAEEKGEGRRVEKNNESSLELDGNSWTGHMAERIIAKGGPSYY